MKKVVLAICIVILGIAGGATLYISQKHQSDSLLAQKTVLQNQLTVAQAKYDSIKQAGKIKTDSWKQYCDSFAPFCLKYPSDWKLEANPLYFTDDQRMYATITNPGKTVTVSYVNPLVKDGSYGSAHIVNVSEMTVGNQKLKLIGSYPVSSGTYSPHYIVVNQNSLAGGTPGAIGHDQSSSLFGVGKYTDISLSGYYSGSNKITSQAQAEAWFSSIDGKTVQAIFESFNTK
jgi:hypothetical protein